MINKLLKSRILFLCLGLLIAGSIGVYAYTVSSSDVSYSNSELEGNSVKDALDDLYDKSENVGMTWIPEGKCALSLVAPDTLTDVPTTSTDAFGTYQNRAIVCHISGYKTVHLANYLQGWMVGFKKDGTTVTVNVPGGNVWTYDVTDYEYILFQSSNEPSWAMKVWITID